MKFRTEINIDKFDEQIKYEDSILTLGSCFADNIAEFLTERKFNVLANPFGVLYNPVSVLNSVNFIARTKMLTDKDLVQNQSEWHSFYHHSDFSHHNKKKCLLKINQSTEQANKFLSSATWLFITLGTSFVYEWKESNEVVSNCHKIPSNKFSKKLLSVNEIIDCLQNIVQLVTNIDSNINILFTVSPIRHWKDGAVDNQISKAQLILAVHKIVESCKKCFYFPSYEIMMDDLRDYRFYEEDLLHPNTSAIKYIFEKFEYSLIDKSVKEISQKIERITKATKHRVRNPISDQHIQFVKNQLQEIDEVLEKYPHLDFKEERKYFKSFLD